MKAKFASALLALSMLAPMLMSCSKSAKITTVKEDEPWYESVRFDLKTEQLSTEMLEKSVVGSSRDRIYHVYSLTNLADYDDYRRTMLDTYDQEGILINRLRVKAPQNCSIDRIISFTTDEDGKKAEALASLFAQGGFSIAVITIDLENGEAINPAYLTNKPGKPLEITAEDKNTYGVSDVFVAGQYNLPVIYTFDGEGSSAHVFSFKGAEYLCELDFSGIPLVYNVEEFSLDPRSNTIFTIGYTAMEGPVVLEFDPETGKRVNYTKYTAGNNDETNLRDYKTTPSGELFKIDSLGNISTFDMKTQKAETVIDSDWYTPYFSDLSAEEVKLISTSSDMAVIYSAGSSDNWFSGYGRKETVTVLKKASANPNSGKKIIELATPINTGMSEYLSNAIYEFNKADNEYIIRVWSKYKTGIKAGRTIGTLNEDDEKLYTMIQELKGSQAPDLAIGIQKNYAMRDDVFDDLTGYLDQEVSGKQFTNIIEASRIGTKQYFLPVTIEIEGLVTDRKLIKDGASGITFDEFDNMIRKKLDGFSPYDYPMSKYNNRKQFILSCIDIKGAIEGSKVDFGTEQFRAAVEYSDRNINETGLITSDDYVLDEELKRVRTGCRYDRLGSYRDFICACGSDDGSYTIIGTPSVDARGPRFRAKETISVIASSDMKEGAKKFINFLFSGAGFGPDQSFDNIVTNKEAMTRSVSFSTEQNNTWYKNSKEIYKYMSGLEKYDKINGCKIASKDMEEQFIKSLSSIGTYYYDDPKITAFLTEEIAPYFAGDRTLDDVILYMNDRTGKYIKEM